MVAAGELLASVALKAVCGKLVDATLKEIALQLNFNEDLSSIEDKLSFIQSYMKDAERRSSKQESVRYWLKKLKDAAYDLEDMLLDFESARISSDKGGDVQGGATARQRQIPLSIGRFKMPHRVKKMRDRIQKIADDMNKFNFREDNNMVDKEVIEKRRTISRPSEVPVGRMNEKERIISMLQTDGEHFIIPIHGFGGLGKTTLARMVFNDPRTEVLFDAKAWVYVSLKFDIVAMCRDIISQLGEPYAHTEFSLECINNMLLRVIVNEKRVLFVLDDLWEENPHKLAKLKTLLEGGKSGSKIIVTTRLEKVARLMNITGAVKLGVLPNSDCWELFCAQAFPPGTVDDGDDSKKAIGQAIVEKCKGVPLAVASLGFLVQGQTISQWKLIRDSDIWADDGDARPLRDTEVLTSLKLSYHYMPYYLKPCFAYCAVFPKGCHIKKSSLIQQWIALGFIQLTDQSLTVQDCAEMYLEELLGMSFLQEVTGVSSSDVNIRTDELVIDGCDKEFLNYFSESMGRCFLDFDLQYRTIQKLKITNSEEFGLQYLPCIPSLQELQIDCMNNTWGRKDKLDILKRMDKLEKNTLSSREDCFSTDLVEALLLAIPHIQYININNEAIYLSDFHLLHQNRDFGITELCLTNLQLVKKANEVVPGEFARYDQLRMLSLRWSRQPGNQTDTDDSAVLQRLQPHANLSALEIRGYQGATFCAWVSNANLYLPTLVKIELVDIPRCECLPSLGQLANLEELHISDMPNIREVDTTSFYGGKHPFRKLRKLHIDGMGNLEVWSTNLEPSAGQMSWNDGEQQLQGDEIFPSLQQLIVKGDPRLTLDSGFQGSIRHIIESCSKLSVSTEEITAYSQDGVVLEVEAKIHGFSDNIELLQYLIGEGATFGSRMSIANLYLPNLVKIELVDIPTCERLPSLGQLANLEELYISDMPNIQKVDTSFYGGKHPFRKLRKLRIDRMGNLEMWSTNLEASAGQMCWNDSEQQLLGDEIFPSLEHLILKGCPRLTLDSGFQGRIRRIIESCSEVKVSPGIFMGWASWLSRIEVEANVFGFSDSSELLRYSINLYKLIIESNSDLTTLPGITKNCRTLTSLQILDCWNFSVLPDWLGDLTSLEELEVHAPKLQCLPHAIKGLTSLKTLTLKKCNYKMRKRCSISGEDYDKIQHIKYHHVQGLEVSISSWRDIALLEKTTSCQLIELNIKDLQHLSSSKAEKINLVGKEELQLLSLEWSSNYYVGNVVVALEKLQPHQNLRRLFIKNYPIKAGFPHWMQSLPNLLVSMELSNVQVGHLHLDHLQNLEDLHVSSFSSCEELIESPFNTLGGRIISQGFEYARSLLRISSTQLHKKLRRVTMARVGKLVWESSCLPSENLFPGLEYLEIDCCLDVQFEPSIPRSARYMISGSEMRKWLFRCPSFKQVMGLSTSASSKLEIKYSEQLFCGSLDSLRHLDTEELTVDSCTDHVPLPESIRGWKSLRKIEILNCDNIERLPEWLGDMASLRELKVETYWMRTLAPCIERLISLQTLALLKCTKRFKQRCSEGGDDWSKIKHIDNLKS